MTSRIPHIEETITGNENVAAYAGSHKNGAASYFKAFFKDFDPLGSNGRFLEIGSGPGFLTELIAKKKPEAQITALEPSTEMIDFARNHMKEQGIDTNVRFVQGSVDDRDVMNSLGQFDLVYSTFSLHHWKKPNTALRYLFSKVNRNGTLFIHDLKRVPWLYHIPIKSGVFESIRAAFTKNEIAEMLHGMGIGKGEYTIKTPFPYFWMSILIHNR